jgi:hypothetical protein
LDASGFIGLIFVIWIAGFAAVIWGLIDVIRVPDDTMFRAGDRLIWVLVVLFANVLGVIIYVAIGRPASRERPPDGSGSSDAFPPPPPAF